MRLAHASRLRIGIKTQYYSSDGRQSARSTSAGADTCPTYCAHLKLLTYAPDCCHEIIELSLSATRRTQGYFICCDAITGPLETSHEMSALQIANMTVYPGCAPYSCTARASALKPQLITADHPRRSQIARCGRRVTRASRSRCRHAGTTLALLKCRISQGRVRKIPVNCSGRRSPSKSGGLHGPVVARFPKTNAGPCPIGGWLALNVSTYGFGRRDVRHVHQHTSGACMSNTSPRWHADQPTD
jgi:hypothetical protein